VEGNKLEMKNAEKRSGGEGRRGKRWRRHGGEEG
jgi:hypothetical protein